MCLLANKMHVLQGYFLTATDCKSSKLPKYTTWVFSISFLSIILTHLTHCNILYIFSLKNQQANKLTKLYKDLYGLKCKALK